MIYFQILSELLNFLLFLMHALIREDWLIWTLLLLVIHEAANFGRRWQCMLWNVPDLLVLLGFFRVTWSLYSLIVGIININCALIWCFKVFGPECEVERVFPASACVVEASCLVDRAMTWHCTIRSCEWGRFHLNWVDRWILVGAIQRLRDHLWSGAILRAVVLDCIIFLDIQVLFGWLQLMLNWDKTLSFVWFEVIFLVVYLNELFFLWGFTWLDSA